MPGDYRIRRARKADGPAFLGLVEELARFEKLDPPDRAARARLLRGAFSAKPSFELYVADDRASGRVVGYAIVLWTFSSFLAKPTLYLEDIYLSPDHRGRGLGRQFLAFLARRALAQKAGRIEGVVLEWNQDARRFYRKSGARELNDWIFFRYDEAALRRTLRKPSAATSARRTRRPRRAPPRT